MRFSGGWRAWIVAGGVVGGVALSAPAAWPQYFGHNKVQYQTFDFDVLRTEHFNIYYYKEEYAAATQAGRLAERWYARYAKILDHQLRNKQTIILYASHPHFEQTNAISGDIGEGTGGVTETLKRRIVLPVAGPLAETDHVIGHELVHAFQFDIVGGGQHSGFASPAVNRLPLWFMEGMAEYLSIGPDDPHTAMWMRDAVRVNDLPSINDLQKSKYFPYRYGQALWAYIAGRFGDETIGDILKASIHSRDANAALESVLHVQTDTLSKQWKAATRSWAAPVIAATDAPGTDGHALVIAKHGGGDLNLAPSLSPDGRSLVFLSEKSLFSVEMYLADAATGKIRRQITHTAIDPHFQSLEFINSSGAWSADGRRFVFGAISKGRPILSIMDVASGHTVKEIPFPSLGEVLNPTWSPDGREIAFSALQGGFTDLFIVDVQTGALRRLTDDRFAEIEPAWSPDGRSIAFVTDRFGTDLGTLTFGKYRLALIDPTTAGITPLTTFDDAKNINPQWAPDGASLFFVSDHGGISNIYRVTLADSHVSQLTNLATGASGLTSESPAISVASHADRLVFSTYEHGKYNLYTIEGTTLTGGAIREARAETATLPPPERGTSPLETLRADAKTGLPDTTAFHHTDYHPALSVDYVAQPSLAVGTTSHGVAIGGGTALYWSDMLGNHNLLTLLQVNTAGGTIANNIAAIVAYENRKSRWDWATEAGQVPLETGTITLEEGTMGGVPVLTERDYRFWQITREVSGTAAYPLSPVQRIEIGGGLQTISFSSEVETQVTDETTGILLSDITESLPDSIASVALVTTSAALVYDNSIFGGTSPILGQRYRIGVSPVVGGLQFIEALADYRKYVMPFRPLTIAGRILHYGRYGSSAESNQLSAAFIGYQSLVRGYNDGSFTSNECVATADNPNGCPVFDQLVGSRLGVANLEARVPLLGALGLIRSPEIPPIEAAAFFDAGVAWTQHETPSFFGGTRHPVSSYGGALRVNLFGFAVGEIDFVHPNDRPGKNWYWQFGLQPGF